MKHIPVMAKEVLSVFADVPKGVFIDATYGLGGHSREIIKKFPNKFRIIGFEKDQEIFKMALENKPEQVFLKNESFSRVLEGLESENPGPITGILFDLGLNSVHIDNPDFGFSYMNPGPLDLRFNRKCGRPVSEMIAELSAKQIQDILSRYGQEHRSRQIAIEIHKEKPATTESLADLIKRIAGPRGFIKSAARVFQALRIFVNNELEEIAKAFDSLIPQLTVGGRIAVISYHSLEDGLVKRTFRRYSGKCFCGPNVVQCECGAAEYLNILTKKPLRPTADEVNDNSRSRPARFRYAQRI